MRKIFSIILLLTALIPTPAQTKYEMRAVWLTTNWGLDWPSQPARTHQETINQQAELCNMLDSIASMGFNTVFFQARIRGEVFYNSELEPWSPLASGTAGKAPNYDPLSYAIEQCHKRGLECHAWLITIPTGSNKVAQRHGTSAVSAQQKHLCVALKGEYYFNPGLPGTAAYLAQLTGEIARHYDVDGIHLDYIRYPDEAGKFPDADTYKRYAPIGMTLKDWRMNNITHIVRTISTTVKAIDPTIMVSAATLGRYTSIEGREPITWACTEGASQDAIMWLDSAYCDFITPMLYYKGESYTPYLIDWCERTEESNGIVAGLGIYRMDKKEGNWSLGDISTQIAESRLYGASGQGCFRARHLWQFPELAILLRDYFYTTPALVPPMRNIDAPSLAPIEQLYVHKDNESTILSWQPVDGAKRYVVYASQNDSVNINDTSHILSTWPVDESNSDKSQVTFVIPSATPNYHSFAVTAIDAYRRENTPVYYNAP